MEDFYWQEDPAGGFAKGSGKIEINGKTMNFDFDAYGACYAINIEGTQYPEFCGGPGDWSWRGMPSGTPGPSPEDFKGSLLATAVAERIEELRQHEIEPSDEPVTQIASQIEVTGDLDDSDEFEDEYAPNFTHVINGRRFNMPDNAAPEDYIKELPVTINLQPRYDRWGDED